jgi:proteasome activator subunit 4
MSMFITTSARAYRASTCRTVSVEVWILILLFILLLFFSRLFSSIDSMTEPHRFTSIITCLAGMARQIVRQTSDFPQGQTYVLPLLMAVLPGIDSNDFKKTAVTFQFLNAMLMLITCVDCSSAITTRQDLTEVHVSS